MQIISVLLTILLFISSSCFAQSDTDSTRLAAFSEKVFSTLDKKAEYITKKLQAQSDRYLSLMNSQEEAIKKLLGKKELAFALQFLKDTNRGVGSGKMFSLINTRLQPCYSGHVDSLLTLLAFFHHLKPTSAVIQKVLMQYTELAKQFSKAAQIRQTVWQRQELLQSYLAHSGVLRKLNKFTRQFLSCEQECRELVEHPAKMETELQQLAWKIPAVQKFFARNSLFTSLFPLPGSSVQGKDFSSLQTRSSLDRMLNERFGKSANKSFPEGPTQIEGLIKGSMNKYLGEKEKPPQAGGVGLNQTTKSFFHRLKFGINLQPNQSANYFPTSAALGISAGYQLNEKFIVGTGASIQLGLGSGWSHVHLSKQSFSIRSFIDWKMKDALYHTGGYERNFPELEVRQKKSTGGDTGFLGISKQYKINKRLQGEIKLLWDFLSYHQTPISPPLLLRIGYGFK
ncbi:MAG: hypothetical protein ACJ75B_12495 [Flavisolibacter sp.]